MEEAFPLDSYSTAVVLIPPEPIQARINGLRNGNDKSYPRWTAHFTLLFPFVAPNLLPKASEYLQEVIFAGEHSPFQIALDHTSTFHHRSYDTIYLAPNESSGALLQSLWTSITWAFKYKGRPFVPHLTLGQTTSKQTSREFLLDKGSRLITGGLTWLASCIVVLVRDELHGGSMNIFRQIDLSPLAPGPPLSAISTLPTVRFNGTAWVNASGPITYSLPRCFSIGTYNLMYDPRYSFSDRLQSVLEIIQHSDPDILCLQEVTDEMLEMLLFDPSIHESYRYSSRDPRGAMENCRNIVILSKEEFHFSWSTLTVGSKQKPVTLARFSFIDGTSFAVASIHLSAGHFPDLEQRRLLEFQTLLDHVKSELIHHPMIIAGDSNFLNSFKPHNCGTDVWDIVHPNASEEEGDTFNPSCNPLAAPPDQFDRSPKRYDRIWIVDGPRSSQFTPIQAAVVGREYKSASDHYLLTALFSTESRKDPIASFRAPLPSATGAFSLLNDTDLESCVSRTGVFPHEEENKKRADAYDELRHCLVSHLQSDSSIQLIVQPVGSFALGVHTSSSDLDCTVVGNLPSSTFWQYILERIQIQHRSGMKQIQLIRFIKDAVVRVLELYVNGLKMDVQYCCAPGIASRWNIAKTATPNDPLFLLPVTALRTFNAYRDNVAILSLLPDDTLPFFRLAHRALRSFCLQKGIFGGRFGYLSSMQLSILLVCEALRQGTELVSASSLLFGFFQTYSSFPWGTSEVSVSGFSSTSVPDNSVSPMTILALNRPRRNLSENVVHSTLYEITSQFTSATQVLDGSTSWSPLFWDYKITDSADQFLRAHSGYIRISIHHWGKDVRQGHSLVGYSESQLTGFLSQLHSVAPTVRYRLWPGQFSEGCGDGDLSVHFFIGLDGSLSQSAIACLLSFENRLRMTEKYYDPTSSYLSVEVVEAINLGSYQLNRPLPARLVDDPVEIATIESDSGTNETSADLDRRAIVADPIWDSEGFSFSRDISRRRYKFQLKKKMATPNQPAPKLRTSADVYNRLMWDSNFGDPNGFAIGYEDRFTGLKEITLSLWKRDVSDREFIPFHRIVYFRRKSDDCIVWDKRIKRDLVFESGLQETL